MANDTIYHNWEKLEQIEKEILKLKKRNDDSFSKTPISLKGFLKGVRVTASEILKSKRGLFTKKFL